MDGIFTDVETGVKEFDISSLQQKIFFRYEFFFCFITEFTLYYKRVSCYLYRYLIVSSVKSFMLKGIIIWIEEILR